MIPKNVQFLQFKANLSPLFGLSDNQNWTDQKNISEQINVSFNFLSCSLESVVKKLLPFHGRWSVFILFLNLYANLTLRKIAIWLSKNCQRLDIFSNKLTKILLTKMTNFVNFFEKNVKFLAVFWQSNGNFPECQLCVIVEKSDNCHNAMKI